MFFKTISTLWRLIVIKNYREIPPITAFTSQSLSRRIFRRFWRTVSKSRGCWEWTARKSPTGYGMFHMLGKDYRAHRVSWWLEHGQLPADLGVLHKCDNPACIRPSHLVLGTQQDNIRDMEAKNRGVHVIGTRHGRARLDPEKVRAIRSTPLQHGSMTRLARLYGVSYHAIRAVIDGTYWAHVH